MPGQARHDEVERRMSENGAPSTSSTSSPSTPAFIETRGRREGGKPIAIDRDSEVNIASALHHANEVGHDVPSTERGLSDRELMWV